MLHNLVSNNQIEEFIWGRYLLLLNIDRKDRDAILFRLLDIRFITFNPKKFRGKARDSLLNVQQVCSLAGADIQDPHRARFGLAEAIHRPALNYLPAKI